MSLLVQPDLLDPIKILPNVGGHIDKSHLRESKFQWLLPPRDEDASNGGEHGEWNGAIWPVSLIVLGIFTFDD